MRKQFSYRWHPTLYGIWSLMVSLIVGQRWEDDPELQSLVKKPESTGTQLGTGAYGSVKQVKIEGATYATKRFRVEVCRSSWSMRSSLLS